MPDYALLKKKKKKGKRESVGCTMAQGWFWAKKRENRHPKQGGEREKLATKSANNTAKVEISDSRSTPDTLNFFSDTSGSIRF